MRNDRAPVPPAHAVRYAQCWEDADILLEALGVGAGDTCLSIASAGDNTLALLARGPKRVVAVDVNPAQIACLELRVGAYRHLSHGELLELIGSRPSERRYELYGRCRANLSEYARLFWDSHPETIAAGIGTAGRFERYLSLFRKRILPLVHGHDDIAAMLRGGTLPARTAFYSTAWNTWRWRLAFRLFFSRTVMSRLGRDRSTFRYVNGSVARRLLERTRYALTELDPAGNPYLHWICTGRHATALPFALRPENFELIRRHLDRLEWHCCSLEQYLARTEARTIDCFNLSDVFEYMSPRQYRCALEQLARSGRRGARLAYWNMLADRHRPPSLAARLRPLSELSQRLFRRDRAFFYGDFVVEEVLL